MQHRYLLVPLFPGQGYRLLQESLLSSDGLQKDVGPHSDLVASLGGSPVEGSMLGSILRLHRPIANSSSATNERVKGHAKHVQDTEI